MWQFFIFLFHITLTLRESWHGTYILCFRMCLILLLARLLYCFTDVVDKNVYSFMTWIFLVQIDGGKYLYVDRL